MLFDIFPLNESFYCIVQMENKSEPVELFHPVHRAFTERCTSLINIAFNIFFLYKHNENILASSERNRFSTCLVNYFRVSRKLLD